MPAGVAGEVDTVRVEVAGSDPSRASVVGLNAQRGAAPLPAMAPQDRATLPTYPFTGVIVTAETALPPEVTALGANDVAERR